MCLLAKLIRNIHLLFAVFCVLLVDHTHTHTQTPQVESVPRISHLHHHRHSEYMYAFGFINNITFTSLEMKHTVHTEYHIEPFLPPPNPLSVLLYHTNCACVCVHLFHLQHFYSTAQSIFTAQMTRHTALTHSHTYSNAQHLIKYNRRHHLLGICSVLCVRRVSSWVEFYMECGDECRIIYIYAYEDRAKCVKEDKIRPDSLDRARSSHLYSIEKRPSLDLVVLFVEWIWYTCVCVCV